MYPSCVQCHLQTSLRNSPLLVMPGFSCCLKQCQRWGIQLIPGGILLLSVLPNHPEMVLLTLVVWLPPSGFIPHLLLRGRLPETEPLLRQQVSSSGDTWHAAAHPGPMQPPVLPGEMGSRRNGVEQLSLLHLQLSQLTMRQEGISAAFLPKTCEQGAQHGCTPVTASPRT